MTKQITMFNGSSHKEESNAMDTIKSQITQILPQGSMYYLCVVTPENGVEYHGTREFKKVADKYWRSKEMMQKEIEDLCRERAKPTPGKVNTSMDAKQSVSLKNIAEVLTSTSSKSPAASVCHGVPSLCSSSGHDLSLESSHSTSPMAQSDQSGKEGGDGTHKGRSPFNKMLLQDSTGTNKRRRRSLIPSKPQINTKKADPSEEESYDSDDQAFPVSGNPRSNCEALNITDPEAVTAYLDKRLKQLQQAYCKIVAKAWIKKIEPKKSTVYPYNGGQDKRPPWWPDDITHKEPDHLRKPERIKILQIILENRLAKIDKLRKATKELENIPQGRMAILSEMFHVLKHQDRWKDGCVSKDTQVYIQSSVNYFRELDASDQNKSTKEECSDGESEQDVTMDDISDIEPCTQDGRKQQDTAHEPTEKHEKLHLNLRVLSQEDPPKVKEQYAASNTWVMAMDDNESSGPEMIDISAQASPQDLYGLTTSPFSGLSHATMHTTSCFSQDPYSIKAEASQAFPVHGSMYIDTPPTTIIPDTTIPYNTAESNASILFPQDYARLSLSHHDENSRTTHYRAAQVEPLLTQTHLEQIATTQPLSSSSFYPQGHLWLLQRQHQRQQQQQQNLARTQNQNFTTTYAIPSHSYGLNLSLPSSGIQDDTGLLMHSSTQSAIHDLAPGSDGRMHSF